MHKEILNDIVEIFKEDSFFENFTFRKKDSSFIQKNKKDYKCIELQYYAGVDRSRDELALEIHPITMIRFDILHKWFEKYSFKTLADQRSNSTYMYYDPVNMAVKRDNYCFVYSRANFIEDVNNLKKDIITDATFVFNNLNTLDKLYQYLVEPILNNQTKLGTGGADWIFEYLTLCKIVKPENYNLLKAIIMKHIEYLYREGEPNVSTYYPKLDEIFGYLESLNF